MRWVIQDNKENNRKKVTLEEEYLTRGVEVEEEVEKLSIGAINVGS